MTFVPLGFLRQFQDPYGNLKIQALEVAQKCGITLKQGLGPEVIVATVLTKLAADHIGLVAEVQRLERFDTGAPPARPPERLEWQPASQLAAQRAMSARGDTVSVAEAAELLDCVPETVRNYLKEGTLNGEKVVVKNQPCGYIYRVKDDSVFQSLIKERQ